MEGLAGVSRLGKADSQVNGRAGHMVLGGLMESDRNATCQCQAS